MKKITFEDVVAATGKNFQCELSLSGDYYRLVCDGSPVIEDSACEDLYGTEESVKEFFTEYLLENEVPEDKKELRCGRYFLKQ